MILYKKDTKGRLRSLEIKVEGISMIQISGLDDGKKVTHPHPCYPKNVGKANETTANEQAIKEVEAKIIAKKTEGYFEDAEEAMLTVLLFPMLAKVYEKEAKKIDWNGYVCVQPKLDGMRGVGIGDNILMSRGGKEIENLDHIMGELKILRDLTGGVPDGELYAHGLSFQENMKLIKKYRPGQTELVRYHVYDMIFSHPAGFEERYERLKNAFKQFALSGPGFQNIELVPTYSTSVTSPEEVKIFHGVFLKDGYEGTIIRHGNAPYKLKGRSSNLLKFKDFQDMQAEVIDVIPSPSVPLQGMVVCKSPAGEFKAALKYSHAERERILREKANYIGELAEIRYFELTDGGLPRHPTCVGFRHD